MNKAKEVAITRAIELDEQILFNRPNSIIICRVVELREKAIRVDYALEPVSVYNSGSNCIVFTYSCWIPKSVIIDESEGHGLTVKKWFENTFKGGWHIKRYYVEKEKQIFI